MPKTTKDKMTTKTHLEWFGKISLEFLKSIKCRSDFIPIMLCLECLGISYLTQFPLVTNLVVHLVRRVTEVASQSLLMW